MAPKEESYFAPLNVVLARSSIKRISVAPTVEATRSGVLTVAEQSLLSDRNLPEIRL